MRAELSCVGLVPLKKRPLLQCKVTGKTAVWEPGSRPSPGTCWHLCPGHPRLQNWEEEAPVVYKALRSSLSVTVASADEDRCLHGCHVQTRLYFTAVEVLLEFACAIRSSSF